MPSPSFASILIVTLPSFPFSVTLITATLFPAVNSVLTISKTVSSEDVRVKLISWSMPSSLSFTSGIRRKLEPEFTNRVSSLGVPMVGGFWL
ncbi:hypothetical protein ES703_116632 [subsurface metagenome]